MKILIDLPFSTFEDFKNLGAINLGRRNGKTLLEVCLDALRKGKPIKDISCERIYRDYVIVSIEHSGEAKECELAFWGSKTKDYEERSFSGYTFDLDGCERYTKEEIQNHLLNQMPFWEDKRLSFYDLAYRDFAIKVDDLLSFKELKTRKVVYVV